MPIIYKKEVCDNTILGVWKITESIDELLSMINFTEEDYSTFEKFKANSRKSHWLSYRLMIRQLMNDRENLEFYYDEHGKLHFKDLNFSLSVTHSGDYSGVIISKNHYVGIDIEKFGDRINNLAEKFISVNEHKYIPEENQHKYLTVLWSAKEALFKLFGKRNIIFHKNILLEKFELQKEGIIKGKIIKDELIRNYKLEYEFSENEDYVLVYAVDKSIKIFPK